MANYEFNNNSFYIDGKLKIEIEEKIIPLLQKRDKDIVFVVDGPERSGKSVFAMLLGGLIASILKTEFNLSNVCMTPDEWRKKIETCPKNSVVIYDEAHRGMASRQALSEINKILINLMMEMGQKNLFVIVVMPTFFMLDKYPALFRARGLFHIYESKSQRGFWVYYNQKNKLKLYQRGKKEFNYNCMKFPGFRGRFYNQYTLNEEEYRLKKAKSFREGVRLTKAEKYIDQRNKLLLILHEKTGYGVEGLVKLMKAYKIPLQKTQLYDILKEIKENMEDSSDSTDN